MVEQIPMNHVPFDLKAVHVVNVSKDEEDKMGRITYYGTPLVDENEENEVLYDHLSYLIPLAQYLLHETTKDGSVHRKNVLWLIQKRLMWAGSKEWNG